MMKLRSPEMRGKAVDRVIRSRCAMVGITRKRMLADAGIPEQTYISQIKRNSVRMEELRQMHGVLNFTDDELGELIRAALGEKI